VQRLRDDQAAEFAAILAGMEALELDINTPTLSA
jgi:hypothetical protein